MTGIVSKHPFHHGDGNFLGLYLEEDYFLKLRINQEEVEFTGDSNVRDIDSLIEYLQTAREQIWGEKE